MLDGSSVGFILISFLLGELHSLATLDLVLYFMEIDLGVKFSEGILVINFFLALSYLQILFPSFVEAVLFLVLFDVMLVVLFVIRVAIR